MQFYVFDSENFDYLAVNPIDQQVIRVEYHFPGIGNLSNPVSEGEFNKRAALNWISSANDIARAGLFFQIQSIIDCKSCSALGRQTSLCMHRAPMAVIQCLCF